MINKEKHVSIFFHAIAGICLISLLIVASLYDLAISHALSNDESVFGLLFITLGELPSYIVLPMVGTILFNANWGKLSNTANYIVKGGFALIVYLGYFLWGVMGSRVVEIPNAIQISAIYSILFTAATIIISLYIKIDYNKLIKFAVFALLVMGVSFVVNRLMKIGWGRVRYRDMLTAGSFDAFTPWYEINGNNGNRSFPSGHATSACNLFVFTVLFTGKKRYLANLVSLLFTVLTCFSRIVVNAHFMSDVIIGATLSYICFYVIKSIVYRKNFSQRIDLEKNKEESI